MPAHLTDPAPTTSRPADLFPTVLLVGAVVVGVSLRAWQYLSNASLWLDELALANNVLPRSIPELLTQPLDFAQVAPLGYLLLLKGIAMVGGEGELALRLPAFLAGVGAVVLVALLAREVVGHRLAWIPTLLVTISAPLIFQAAQVKPYSGDLLLTTGLLLFAVRAARAASLPRLLLPATVGVLAPWFSFPALFALAAAGLALLLGSRRWTGQAVSPSILLVLSLWTASAAAALVVSFALVPETTTEFMKDYWTNGFPRVPPSSLADLLWPFSALTELLRELGNFRGSTPLAVVTTIGMVAWVVRGGRTAVVALVPVFAALAAATLQLYPLSSRTALWATALVAIFLVFGTWVVLERLTRSLDARLPALLLPLCVGIPLLIGGRSPLPPGPEQPRPVLQHLTESARPGDATYIHYSGWQAWQYYAPRLGVAAPTATIGSCSATDLGVPLREIQALAGHDRLWIFFSHTEEALGEREIFTRFLTLAGAQLFEEFPAPTSYPTTTLTSSILGYDLREARLAGAAGDSVIAAILADPGAAVTACQAPFIPDSLARGATDRLAHRDRAHPGAAERRSVGRPGAGLGR